MKIAFIGNMNNNFFSIVRYLRDRGYDAELFLLKREFSHFHPYNDSSDDSYKLFTHKLSWGDLVDFIYVSRKKIRNQFSQYDKIVCCGWALAYLNSAKVNVDIFIPYGSDLYKYPYYHFSSKFFVLNHLSYYQKRGILSSRNIMFEWPCEIFYNSLKKLGYKNTIIKSQIPMLYELEYINTDESIVDKNLLLRIKKLRSESDIVIFHHTRHGWLNEKDPISLKGNDKLIHGLKLFQKRNQGVKCSLVTFEYGVDVAESKKLINKLGIDDIVTWFPLMSRSQLLYFMKYSDIVAGEFHRSWLTYGVVIEALMSRKIVMQYRNDSLYDSFYDELYPLMSVKTAEDICQSIEDFQKNKEKYKDMIDVSYDWYKKYCVNLPLDNLIASFSE
jgi:hypothetical protein